MACLFFRSLIQHDSFVDGRTRPVPDRRLCPKTSGTPPTTPSNPPCNRFPLQHGLKLKTKRYGASIWPLGTRPAHLQRDRDPILQLGDTVSKHTVGGRSRRQTQYDRPPTSEAVPSSPCSTSLAAARLQPALFSCHRFTLEFGRFTMRVRHRHSHTNRETDREADSSFKPLCRCRMASQTSRRRRKDWLGKLETVKNYSNILIRWLENTLGLE